MKALRDAILVKLRGSSAKRPVDVTKLYPLGKIEQVQACLMAMLGRFEVQCCVIASRKAERSVWWLAGNIETNTDWYGVRGKK